MKIIIYGKDAREKLRTGVNKLAKAVVSTLGPKARNVAIDQSNDLVNIIHDGVSIANEIFLEDPFENMGAKLVRQAASKTADIAGDGTSTTALIAQMIINKGLDVMEENNANPMMMQEGFTKALDTVLKEIDTLKTEVKEDEIEKVASISAQNPQIGKLIAEALQKVGKDGLVTVEEGKSMDLSVEYKEGMEFDSPFLSPYFATNDKGEAELDNPWLLITDKKISSLQDILPALEIYIKHQTTNSLAIIAVDLSGEALATLVLNKMRGSMKVLAIKAPSTGGLTKEMLEDIAVLTGGKVISEDTGVKIVDITEEDFGQADKVWSDKMNTKIIGGKGKKEAIDARVTKLKEDVKKATNEYDRLRIKQRIAKLVSGVGIIMVGASTPVEFKDKKERVIDAVAATKAALEEGIVPGGGVTLLKARKALISLMEELKDPDQKLATQILYDSLGEPIQWIVKNAGGNPKEVLEKVESSQELDYGFDVMTMTYGSMKNIIDPVKVTKSVVTNALSIGMMALTTEALIANKPEEKK